MADLMARSAHLLTDGGHLVAATADCVQKCCGCLACVISGRVGTVTVSGITSVSGNIVTNANDLCGICGGFNGSYGGAMGLMSPPALDTFACNMGAGPGAAECEGDLLDTFEVAMTIVYNASASTVNVTNCGIGPGTTNIPPDHTLVSASLVTGISEIGGGSVCSGGACFSLLQAGRIACPFSGLSLPLTSSSGDCLCNFSGASVSVGVA